MRQALRWSDSVSGAVTLSLLLLLTRKKESFLKAGNWRSAFFLFAYAICFSFAASGLTTATGALILPLAAFR